MSQYNVAVTFRPLTQWPAGRERTADWQREDAKFKASGKYVEGTGYVAGARTPVLTTYGELDREMWAISASDVVVQVDVRSEKELRQSDSRPVSGAVVKSSAVVVSFKRKGTPIVFACDHFRRWDDNLRAIVLGLEGLRRLERYHIARAGDQYRGWQALPASTTTALSTEQAADVIVRRVGLPYTREILLRDALSARNAVRAAAAKTHPDAGGLPDDFKLVQEAKRVLETHFGGSL